MKAIFILLTFLFSVGIYGQNCTINYGLTAPGADPSSLSATVGTPFSQSMTLLFPQQNMNGDTYTTFSISSVELPLGLTWEWGQVGAATPFDPQTDPYTCMMISGTPAEAGSYTISIVASGILANGTSEDYSFQASLTVDSSNVDNGLFSMSPARGCETVTVAFAAENISNYVPVPGLTNGITHQWDFGNGNQSSDAFPAPQTYLGAGVYPITYTRIIDTIGFKIQSIQITGVGATDAVGYGEPDLYIQIMDAGGNIIYNTASALNDANLPQNYAVNELLNNPPYTIRVMDDDSDNMWGTDDDNAIDGNENTNTVNLSLPTINSYGTTTLSGGSGSLTFSYTVFKDTSHIIKHDTINVYTIPAAPVITEVTTTPLQLSTTDLGFVYHWFVDNNRVLSVNGSEITPNTTGNYTVMVVDDHGCSNISAPKAIDFTSIQLQEDFQFSIFPNPANNVIQIQSEVLQQGGSIFIVDATGREVISKVGNQSKTVSLDISSLSDGIYTVFVQNQFNQQSIRKIVVQ